MSVVGTGELIYEPACDWLCLPDAVALVEAVAVGQAKAELLRAATQLDLKENIQNLTNGKIYVKLAPGGQLGAGGAMARPGGRHRPGYPDRVARTDRDRTVPRSQHGPDDRVDHRRTGQRRSGHQLRRWR